MVEEKASAYLSLALPTRAAKYTPIIKEFGSSWELSVEEAVNYLEGKWLLKFVLDHYISENSDLLRAVTHSDGPTWILSTFFNNVTYKDPENLETARRSVVGRCFWYACSHGLSIAVDNMLRSVTVSRMVVLSPPDRVGWSPTCCNRQKIGTHRNAPSVFSGSI
jgi:hypothetical protein